MGILMTSCSFIMIHKDPNIAINPYDMNVIVTAILARPQIKTSAHFQLCLPGISDDGYLSFTVKYVTPNLIVMFVTLNPEDHAQCLAKADSIGRALEQHGLVQDITKSIKENYLESECLMEGSAEMIPAIIKDNQYNQVLTYNLPFFSLTPGQRKKLRKMEETYQKSIEPGAHKSECSYLLKTINETNYISVKDNKSIILLGNNHVSDKLLVKTAARIRKSITANEDAFFITRYSPDKN
eukprot:TRINITY_DN1226_c0_g1_i2.p1 TRINITY_DN1226_c0_g1~~TRINITY_DN1226_c0_g1_i2.p1  ORF type:complete len:239 (-),score=64.66 TRINITY_DN1226_c0_g1_i2:64-780(-)